MSENNAIDACDGLDVSAARDLLRQQGYGMCCRFGHVHATTDTQELHVCILADLATMSSSRFLAGLDEAMKQSLQLALSLEHRG